MILGSHNSWSYLPVKKWWMRPFAFMARCQCKTIQEQYELGVRCFDLRVRWERWQFMVAHGMVVYDITEQQLMEHLRFLDENGDCMVRVIHEARHKKQYEPSKPFFQSFCYKIKSDYSHIRFWCGRNLYNWEVDYDFGDDPTCEEKYASVCSPAVIDDWWPWFFSRFHNRKIHEQGTEKDVLLIDYVNINSNE